MGSNAHLDSLLVSVGSAPKPTSVTGAASAWPGLASSGPFIRGGTAPLGAQGPHLLGMKVLPLWTFVMGCLGGLPACFQSPATSPWYKGCGPLAPGCGEQLMAARTWSQGRGQALGPPPHTPPRTQGGDTGGGVALCAWMDP